MGDPVFTRSDFVGVSGANGLLGVINGIAGLAGWIVDEYDTTLGINTQNGGHELYLHTNSSSYGQQAYFSLKAFAGQGVDHHGIMVYMNTGYNVNKRVDNQPGLFVKCQNNPSNVPLATQIFANQWDTGLNFSNPADTGLYLTAAHPAAGAIPKMATNIPNLNTPGATPFTVYTFRSPPVGGCSDCLAFIWYVGNQMYSLIIGRVIYDNPGVAPDNTDGFLLSAIMCDFNQSTTLNNPPNNSVNGNYASSFAPTDAPFSIIRPYSVGGVQWPTGTANGNPLALVGTIVKNSNRLEAADLLGQVSAINRPSQSFDACYNNQQVDWFPNPRMTIHREVYGGQFRCGFARPRSISRWPNGGDLRIGFGAYASGLGATDWSDAHYFFPWYIVPTLGLSEGSPITEGLRQYDVFPGNRGGTDPYAAHRTAGIGFRVA